MNTTSRNKTAQTFEFEQENFPSIVLREDLTEVWNDVALSSLPPNEQIGLQLLLTASGIDRQADYDEDRVLLVKADKSIPKQVYGPAIFRDGDHAVPRQRRDRIVLRVGNNAAFVEQKGDRFHVGELKGMIAVQTKEDASGKPYPVATISLVGKNKTVFKIRVSLDTQNNSFSVSDIEAALINEESILPFLAQVPTQTIKMHELGLGEWEVKAISQNEGEYGTSYKLHLASGAAVWAKGNSQILLDSGYQMQPNAPLTLVITQIEEISEGKYRVDNALRERLPRLTGDPSNPSTIDATATEIEEPEEDLDSIPF
jgi:hypothetical protein